MDNPQNNRRRMFGAVLKVSGDNASLASGVAAMARQVTALQGVTDTIDAVAQAQEQSNKGVTLDKKRISEILVNATLGMAGAVGTWASENDNEELRVKMDFNPTKLSKTEDGKLPEIARNVATEAGEHDLAEYGAGPLAISAFNAKIDAYNAIVNAPDDARRARKGLTESLAQQFELGDKILEHRLDKLMDQFRESQPDYFRDYKNARMIIDRGGGHTVTPAPAPTAAPASAPVK